ncbi:MAG: TetR/AcrR family transcriptional regulator [Solirubrobacteraceae bacterium]
MSSSTNVSSGRTSLDLAIEHPFPPRQQEILDELERTFIRHGLNVTVGELAKAARCSRRTLYELATSKEELFLLVFDRRMRRLQKASRQAAARETEPVARMREFLATAVVTFEPLSDAFIAAVKDLPQADWLWRFHVNQVRDLIIEIIEGGVERRLFRPVHASLMADVVISSTFRVIDPDVLKANGISSAEALHELYTFFGAGLEERSASDA